MKKILLSILSIFFCLGMLTGGAIMLSGCNSSSYSENNPLEEKPGGDLTILKTETTVKMMKMTMKNTKMKT